MTKHEVELNDLEIERMILEEHQKRYGVRKISLVMEQVQQENEKKNKSEEKKPIVEEKKRQPNANFMGVSREQFEAQETKIAKMAGEVRTIKRKIQWLVGSMEFLTKESKKNKMNVVEVSSDDNDTDDESDENWEVESKEEEDPSEDEEYPSKDKEEPMEDGSI